MTQTIKLMTYNLFEGAHQSYAHLVDFIKNSSPDVLCLQEVNGWHEDNFARLKDFATQCGFAYYTFGDSNTEFKLATLSRYPVVEENVYTEGFWHSAIVVRVGDNKEGATIVNLHLNPRQETSRLEETKKLLALLDLNTPTILVGDFNSLSKQDNYPISLLSELRAHGIRKFGTDKLEYLVTDTLEAANLVDVAAALRKTTNTVPSAFNKDKNHEVSLRLDYAFASEQALPHITNIEVIKNRSTDTISDHYPVVVSLELVT